MKYQATIDENTLDIVINPKENTFKSGENSKSYVFEKINGRHILRIGTKVYKIDNVQYDGTSIEFSMNSIWHKVDIKDEQQLLLDKLGFKTGVVAGKGILNAPMPGKILEIMVSEGDEVEIDQPLAILEAMKMENELKAPIKGTISTISAEVGNSIEKNAPILEIEPIG